MSIRKDRRPVKGRVRQGSETGVGYCHNSCQELLDLLEGKSKEQQEPTRLRKASGLVAQPADGSFDA